MAFFQACTALTANLAKEIADSAGASADNEMTARASKSLAAAFEHINNFGNWEFTLTEAPTILVTGPFAVTGVSATGNGSVLNTPTQAHGVIPGDFVLGSMFAAAGRVTATATAGGGEGRIGFADTFNATLISTAGVSADVTANRDSYDLPTDWKQPYTVRLLNSQYTLQPIQRRFYERNITNEFTPGGTPQYYDWSMIGGIGKIRIVRPPSNTERMRIVYYRRMMPSAVSADVPAHFEPYLVALGKWHFLTDKADAGERAQTWFQFAQNGLTQMMKETSRQPDETLLMLPGHYSYNAPTNPNSVRDVLYDYW